MVGQWSVQELLWSKAGHFLPKVALGLFVSLVGGLILMTADRLTGGDGVAGLAAATTAGNAALVPAIIAEANPIYEAAAEQATVLVAASVVVTAIMCPILTSAWAKRLRKKNGGKGPNDADEADNVAAPVDDSSTHH